MALQVLREESGLSPGARALAASLDVEMITAEVTADILRAVWPERDDPGFRAAVHRSVHGNISAIREIVSGALEIEAANPRDALEFAELTAQLGVPAWEVDRAYRVGVASLWKMWVAATSPAVERGDWSAEELIGAPWLAVMAYIDHILSSVQQRYDATRTELHRTRKQLRRLLVTQILEGGVDEAGEELDQRLDYRLADTHLALLVQSGSSGLERWVADLRGFADARGTLAFQHGPHSWVVWLGRPGGFEAAQLSQLRRALTHPEHPVAVGEPAAGIEGLRSTHRQALETAQVQQALGVAGHRCLWACNVRLETMLLADEPRARRFVEDELGALAEPGAVATRLRETLVAWLATGSNVSAAAILGVHENTVRNRIRQAEELLDAPLASRRTELQVALRLDRVLSARDAGEALAASP